MRRERGPSGRKYPSLSCVNTTHTKVIVVTVLSMVFGVTKPTFSIPVVVIVKGEVTSVDAGLGSAFSVGDTMDGYPDV